MQSNFSLLNMNEYRMFQMVQIPSIIFTLFSCHIFILILYWKRTWQFLKNWLIKMKWNDKLLRQKKNKDLKRLLERGKETSHYNNQGWWGVYPVLFLLCHQRFRNVRVLNVANNIGHDWCQLNFYLLTLIPIPILIYIIIIKIRKRKAGNKIKSNSK